MKTSNVYTSRTVLPVLLVFIFLTGSAFAQCEDGEVELTWATFWVGTNPLTPWGNLLTEDFNEQFNGQYCVVTEEIPGDAAYRDKMRADAAANALPDIITGNITLMKQLTETGRLAELTPFLEQDTDWSERFVDGTFENYRTSDGEIFAIPYSRDYVGIFYNQALFDQAGVEAYPTNWNEFMTVSQQLSEAGITPFAMDGDWVTRLMWANMVGTQPGGAEWLSSQVESREFVGVEPVVVGTEMLRDYHEAGYVNLDAYTSEYNTAATLFLQAQAAMIANGPWMINQLSGEVAETAEGLYENVDYEISPANGIILVIGEAAFAVGAKDEARIEGAVEFIKFLTSDEQMANQLYLVGRAGPTKLELAELDQSRVAPMALEIIEKGRQVEVAYPHTGVTFTPEEYTAFVNFWPSYARGNMTTEEFLGELEEAGN